MGRHAPAYAAEPFDLLVRERSNDRTELLEQLILQLKHASSTSTRAEFAELFGQAKKILELSDAQLSEMFDVSRPTIGRWERGEFAPHPLGRKPLFAQFAKVAREKLRLLKS